MKKIIWIVVIVLVIGVIWKVSKNDNAGPSTGGPIKIAALLPLSGDAAAWGQNAERAIQLATEKINNEGGVNDRQVEIIYEDTGGDPKKAVSSYQKVTSIDKVTAVVGPLGQTEVMAVLPIIIKTKTPTIIPSYVPLKNRPNLSNPLLVWMDAEEESSRIAEHVYGEGIRNVGVIGTLDSWEQTISDAFTAKFESLGGNITIKEIVQPSVSDMKLAVTKVLGTKPEAVFLGTYYQFINSAKVLSDQNFQGKLYSIEVDDYLAGESASWTNGLRFIAPDYYQEDFVKIFQDKFAQAPGLPAGQSYDAVNILFSILKQSENRDDILAAIDEFTSYDGVSGKFEINADGRTSLPTALFEVESGKIKRLSYLPLTQN
ncbi:MAG: penicillin-binding protein activator [Patescibacteria group bacterium]